MILVKILIFIFSLLVFCSQLQASNDSVELTFGLYSSEKPSTLVKKFTPVLKKLEIEMAKDLNKPVEITLHITKTYDEARDAFLSGQFDFVRFGPTSYVKSKQADPSIEIAAIETVQGSKVFYGIVAVPKNSDTETIDDLVGKTFAFGNRSSTIGRFLAQRFLTENNITSSKLSDYAYLDRHDLVGRAVGDGRFDAGALKENTFNKLVDDGIPIREVARFPNVTKPWLVSSHTSPEVKKSLSKSLLSIGNSKVLRPLKIDGFTIGTHSDFADIEFCINHNDSFFDN